MYLTITNDLVYTTRSSWAYFDIILYKSFKLFCSMTSSRQTPWFLWFIYNRCASIINVDNNVHLLFANLIEYAVKHRCVDFLELSRLHHINCYFKVNFLDKQHEYVVYCMLKNCPSFTEAIGAYSSRRYRDDIFAILKRYQSKLASAIKKSSLINVGLHRNLSAIVVRYSL